MNSIDAVIALCAIIASTGLIIGVISVENTNAESAQNSLQAKTLAIKCSSIIDSMYSNNSQNYLNSLECNGTEHTVTSTVDNSTKMAQTIPKVEKKTLLEVEMLDHYK